MVQRFQSSGDCSRRCGHAALEQLLREPKDLGQGPPWEAGVSAHRAARPQWRSHRFQFAAGSLAQGEAQVRKHLSQAALPVCDMTWGEGSTILQWS